MKRILFTLFYFLQISTWLKYVHVPQVWTTTSVPAESQWITAIWYTETENIDRKRDEACTEVTGPNC